MPVKTCGRLPPRAARRLVLSRLTAAVMAAGRALRIEEAGIDDAAGPCSVPAHSKRQWVQRRRKAAIRRVWRGRGHRGEPTLRNRSEGIRGRPPVALEFGIPIGQRNLTCGTTSRRWQETRRLEEAQRPRDSGSSMSSIARIASAALARAGLQGRTRGSCGHAERDVTRTDRKLRLSALRPAVTSMSCGAGVAESTDAILGTLSDLDVRRPLVPVEGHPRDWRWGVDTRVEFLCVS